MAAARRVKTGTYLVAYCDRASRRDEDEQIGKDNMTQQAFSSEQEPTHLRLKLKTLLLELIKNCQIIVDCLLNLKAPRCTQMSG